MAASGAGGDGGGAGDSRRRFRSTGASRVVFAAGASDTIGSELLGMNLVEDPSSLVALVVSTSSSRAKDVAQFVAGGLKSSGVAAEVHAEAVQHVPDASVAAAVEVAKKVSANVLVAVGGGSPIGLAKAVALETGLPVVAVPTTYSGSEVTNIYGITGKDGKKTGRDERVRPKLVVYDPELYRPLPAKIGVPSLFNAMAHAVEALWSSDADPVTMMMAEEGVRMVARSVQGIASGSPSIAHLDDAVYASYLCGVCLVNASMAVQHKLCHVLGGSFGLPHAATHCVMLPHSVAFNHSVAPEAMDRLAKALGANVRHGAAAAIYDLQKKCDCNMGLRQLGMKLEDVSEATKRALVQKYPNPRELTEENVSATLLNAFHGRRPSHAVTHIDLMKVAATASVDVGGPHALMTVPLPVAAAGAPIESATAVIVCVMGRFASAERIIEMAQETFGERAGLAFIAPQAAASTWYPDRFLEPNEKNEPHLSSALGVVRATVAYASKHVPASQVVLFGFSQGACLALEFVARSKRDDAVFGGQRLGGVVAYSGALLGPRDARAEYGGSLASAGVPVELCVATSDSHVPLEYVRDTAAVFAGFGSAVNKIEVESDQHKIFPQASSAARAVLDRVLAAGVSPVSVAPARAGEPVTPSGAVLLGKSASDPYSYLTGFGSHLTSEALPDAVPRGHNAPKHGAYGLYSEMITGTAFTKMPREHNLRTWFYRIAPSVSQSEFKEVDGAAPLLVSDFGALDTHPELMRWTPPDMPEDTDFVQGMATYGGVGEPASRHGMAIHAYRATKNMVDKAFYNSDGDMLVVPEVGSLDITTEFGKLRVNQGEIFLLPRGLKMSVSLPEGSSRGWIQEVYNGHFELPGRGPIGSNHGADERHFCVPVAAYEDRACPSGFTLWNKHGGHVFEATLDHSCFDVVGWFGNYVPYKYNLEHFSPVGSVKWDHIDPSVLTVITCQMDTTGQAVCDFIVFNGRWGIAEDSFAPPFAHRNQATEFNCIIKLPEKSAYEGFAQGVCFHTPYMTGHFVAKNSYEGFMGAPDKATNTPLRLSDDSIWMMFESTLQIKLTRWAKEGGHRDHDFRNIFKGYRRTFDPTNIVAVTKKA